VLTAEAIAHAVVGFDLVADQLTAAEVTRGTRFREAQIYGVVEEDFFDWVLRQTVVRRSCLTWCVGSRALTEQLWVVVERGAERGPQQLGPQVSLDGHARHVLAALVEVRKCGVVELMTGGLCAESFADCGWRRWDVVLGSKHRLEPDQDVVMVGAVRVEHPS